MMELMEGTAPNTGVLKAIDLPAGALQNDGMTKLSSVGTASGAGSFGLLILRVILGVSLFYHHGLEKFTHFSRMAGHFPHPVHFGSHSVGSHASLIFALASDGICSLLVALGLATRPAALIVVINLTVVYFFVDPRELVLIYLAGFLTLLFTGAGRFSLDARF